MNFTILWITLIIILGTLLRICGIIKDGGLWNDEYISWMISAVPFGQGFFKSMLSQCHMPLYYLYLKFFGIFSNADTYLRLTSVLPGIISIPVMYSAGREKSRLTGFMCALFTALSSFLIYYSQEVRFYSLLFLFSAFSLYFTIRMLKKPTKKNLFGLLISDFLILFTHTIGFVFVFFNLAFVCYKLRILYKKMTQIISVSFGVILVIISPLLIKIFTTVSFAQWWSNLSFTRIVQVFTDFFTPVISEISLIENIHGFNFNSVFMILPAMIAFIVFVAGFFDKNLRKENQIGIVAALTFVVAIFAAMTGKLVLDSKYVIEIYPILIFIFCSIIDSCDKKWFSTVVFTLFFILQIGYIFSGNYSAFLFRNEGNLYAVKLIKSSNLKPGDFIVMTYYPTNRFEKYMDFSKYNLLEIHKGNFNEYYLPELTYKETVSQGKNKYRGAFINATMPKGEFSGSKLIDEINKNVYYKMKPGQKVAFVFLESVSFLDEQTFANIVMEPDYYKKAPLLYLVFSDIRNEIIKTIPKNAKNLMYQALGDWTIITFER